MGYAWTSGIRKKGRIAGQLYGECKEILHHLEFPLKLPQRVQVPNNQLLGFWVIVIIVQVLGKYMKHLDT